jgi:hypothetical protein
MSTPHFLSISRTNAQNDVLLHRLVHTKLLSGSLNPELDLTPAHRRKALAGRVLELSGGARLGKGERAVREVERNKAAKRVREGIVEKQKEREKQQLEEARPLNWFVISDTDSHFQDKGEEPWQLSSHNKEAFRIFFHIWACSKKT